MKSFEAKSFVLQIRLLREKVTEWDAYPFCLPALQHLDTLHFDSPVTFFVGENGSGKSTIMEALALGLGFNAEGGSRNFRFNTRESHSSLHTCLRITKGIRRPRTDFFLRAESFYNTASYVDDVGATEYYGNKSLHAQSHGESFMALLMQRFGKDGLYLLDEPEAALSPSRQLAMLRRMYDLVKLGSQFIIATHSPILLAFPEARIYALSPDGIDTVAYKETEPYRVTREFLQQPEKILQILLDESDESPA